MKFLDKYAFKIPKIWFYEIKGVQDVATSKETKTAKKLPESRSKIFLETRAYLRQSLSTLFNLDPLKIPLNANPGEPPTLPPGMGNLSLSHCKDAIVIAWHSEKIGIDIERIDRNFKYIKFAEKYFLNTNKITNRNQLTKRIILNQWCAVEAAIKWDHGKLSKDIRNWQYIENQKKLIHKAKNLHLNYSQINIHNWTIVLAYKKNTHLSPEIICSSYNF